jgi:hypothetical protein
MTYSALNSFYEVYLKAMDKGEAAIFAGAGLSQPAGYVNWKELLRDIAAELDLDIDKETDLIGLAQYHVNARMGRAKLNRLLIENFTKDVETTKNHQLIAKLPIDTIWTTNYDNLIEKAFESIGKRADVKISQANLVNSILNRNVTVYKMHGDISQPQDAVLTKDDYETYSQKRELFSIVLKAHLVSKTFLFLGFSFTDPNIDFILSRIRALLGQDQREHFCIMKRLDKPKGKGKALADYEYKKRQQELRLADLRRYSIEALMIDDYSEVTTILEEMNRLSHRNSIFVSGSAHDFDPLGRDRVEEFTHSLGKQIIKRDYNLVSGFGLGIGGIITLGALEPLYASKTNQQANRTIIRPFPQSVPQSMTREQLWTKYREEMISMSGFAVFVCGNKLSGGKTVIADGMLEEFKIAKALGKYPIPIGATGWAAQKIWKEVTSNLDSFYPKGGVKGHFEVLGNPNKSNGDYVEAIFAIIKRTASS